MLSVAEADAIARPAAAISKMDRRCAKVVVGVAEARVVEVAAMDKAVEADCFVCSTSIAMDSYRPRRSMVRSPCLPNLMLTKTESSMRKN